MEPLPDSASYIAQLGMLMFFLFLMIYFNSFNAF